jgi:hypothetical protein
LPPSPLEPEPPHVWSAFGDAFPDLRFKPFDLRFEHGEADAVGFGLVENRHDEECGVRVVLFSSVEVDRVRR